MTRIAIIGSGPTGIYTLRGLVACPQPLTISIFEELPDPGKGTPYHPAVNDRAMLANIASIEIPRIVDTLVEWLNGHSDPELSALGLERARIGEREFYARVVIGEFLAAQFWKLAEQAERCGHTVTIRAATKITDVRLEKDTVALVARQGDGSETTESFDHVVMATGHDWPENTEVSPGYFVSPWPASAIKRIEPVEIGILGTSLSGIDAAVTVATSHGIFLRDEQGRLGYQRTAEGLHMTMMSRKGLLPESDFYCPIPYEPLRFCTRKAIDTLISQGSAGLLDNVFDLFKAELGAADPDCAASIGLGLSTIEDIADRYFRKREALDQFVAAARNLAEAKKNKAEKITVQWRYTILRMHEVIARAVPHLDAEDLKRFHKHFKTVFVDDYATVPHESVERLLALHAAGVLDVMALGQEYEIERSKQQPGVTITAHGRQRHFAAFIDATGQHAASASDLPFPSLKRPGLVKESATETSSEMSAGSKRTGGIDVDKTFRPIIDQPVSRNLYCVSVPFLLHKLPFIQGITNARDMGEIVSTAIIRFTERADGLLLDTLDQRSENVSPTDSVPSSVTPE
ncbi:FAD/NAD(P) binding domain-containing protein [Rhizobium wenxiniae]|uniref:Putative NAD(P)/FAD-binding protein YdhS n=1 Tax=Rhizobium wenxiniae TaxID=1737357 RepID=A0A7X0D373_9HYPH|nr:FAD/NAD(P)-binding protein [Rhizobium wenxiniae]MBB6166242.1 putative NAD(P)/FAD-binding protein YdhS [Rhizobium wenxiniae]GGG22219.1 FAD/NAD(P) binding domain-containing protein [Rhizobium wenxiniae]